MPRKAASRRTGGLQNILAMHNDEWHKERGLARVENMCFAFNEKHSHAGQVAVLWGERLLQARNIVWVKCSFQVGLMCTFLGWARGGCAAGAGTILGSGQGSSTAWELLPEGSFSPTEGAALLLLERDQRRVLQSQHKLPQLLLHQLKVGPGPSSPPQAETLLIYSHGLWGQWVSPDELPVCRRMSRHT